MSVVARWYPCALQLPGEPRPRSKAYVLLMEGTERSGLHVWRHPGEEAEVHLPVNWQATKLPKSDRQARVGVDVHLSDGRLVVITPQASCRCGALGRWAGPAWANSVTVRS